jgi:hypothetical protein
MLAKKLESRGFEVSKSLAQGLKGLYSAFVE